MLSHVKVQDVMYSSSLAIEEKKEIDDQIQKLKDKHFNVAGSCCCSMEARYRGHQEYIPFDLKMLQIYSGGPKPWFYFENDVLKHLGDAKAHEAWVLFMEDRNCLLLEDCIIAIYSVDVDEFFIKQNVRYGIWGPILPRDPPSNASC